MNVPPAQTNSLPSRIASRDNLSEAGIAAATALDTILALEPINQIESDDAAMPLAFALLLCAVRGLAKAWEIDYTEAHALAYRTVLNREDRSPWASLRTSD